ncbi:MULTISPECIES: XRE family transcriptional regulator [unclassified Ensifer]|uniref:helix-turn-helix domain-containing protein n=1 Tax=unclassified Ensifer TaxID=2633371 RepID=UPI0008131588|nr:MULTISPECIES: XRE family transcriptional regulator [unclassified Ensifer]OCP19021.1 LacI family transcriptional regulator [Ensifer sp. LC384]OCP28059.1 LacI family transcriptional regulator [Ensifer sp. LC54]
MDTKVYSLDQRISDRIRLEREIRGWSLTELAERSGVSRTMIHKIERADSSPTATLLARLSGAFGLTMSTLIARAEMSQGRLSRRQDQSEWRDPQTGYLRRHVSPMSDLPLELVEIELPGGANVPIPASAYALHRRWIWVKQGILTFVEGSETHTLGEGDCLELGAPQDCVFRNVGSETCIYAVILLRTG